MQQETRNLLVKKEKYTTKYKCASNKNSPDNDQTAAIEGKIFTDWRFNRTNLSGIKKARSNKDIETGSINLTYKYTRPCNPNIENTAESFYHKTWANETITTNLNIEQENQNQNKY